MQFKLDGQIYSYNTVDEFIQSPSTFLHTKDNYKDTNYINISSAFDIETSRINEHMSTMWLWGFALDEYTIIGRTWEEFKDFLQVLSNTLELSTEKRLLCWVHNLSYEHGFMRRWLEYEWDEKRAQRKVFATSKRDIIYCITNNYIEFRDSLILTQRPLAKLPSTYNLPIQKLTDKFDYNRAKHYKSPLTYEDIAYQVNDVQILRYFHQRYIKPTFMKNGIAIPLTSTGIVRNELKRNFKKLDKTERARLRKRLQRSYPSQPVYEECMRWLFRGGYTHANRVNVGELLVNEDMGSYDFKSSYPAVLLHNKFPWRFCKKDIYWFYEHGFNRKILEDTAYFGVFTFTNIRAKTTHSIESSNKIMREHNAVFDNGRLISARNQEKDGGVERGYITVMLTEVDMQIYSLFYEWDLLECHMVRVASKEELPHYLKDMILKYFYLKETIDKKKNIAEYNCAKAQLNSIYGMCVTSLLNVNMLADEFGDIELSDKITEYDRLVQSQILLPWWGIWCTAYSRYNLLSTFSRFQNQGDIIYSDTDSLKIKNVIGNKYIFDTYNDKMQRINNTMYVGGYDREIFTNLGKFDYEGGYTHFKTLGAKRYMSTEIHKGKLDTHSTIAGCRKGTLESYAAEIKKSPYEIFENGLCLDEEYSKKLTSFYNDEEFIEHFTDEDGETVEIHEKSCITLNKTTFRLSMSSDYIKLLLSDKWDNRRVGKRSW